MKEKSFHDRCAELLQRQERMCQLFSGDQRLTYEIDDEGETFSFLPKQLRVKVPLDFFRQIHADESQLLWHLYAALALYPDWQKNPENFLSRPESYRAEAEIMTGCMLARARKCGVENDAAYQPSVIYAYVQDEIDQFLQDMDRFASCLIVEAKAPVYREEKTRKEIGEMLLIEDSFAGGEEGNDAHRKFGAAFTQAFFFGTESLEEGRVKKAIEAPVFGEPLFVFLKEQETQLLIRRAGADAREQLVHTFVMPAFVKLWKEDIKRMSLQPSGTGEEMHSGQTQPKRTGKRPDQTKENRRRMLTEMQDEKQEREKAVRQAGQEDLSQFGVTGQDMALFRHYETLIRPQREQMKRFWQQLIGEAARETGVKVQGVTKGELDVPILIRQWPAFVEAQQKQNYRGLQIFDEWELQKQTRILPETLDISFVIDNSGSMRSGKLQPAREALAIVLLSLQDFEKYLAAQALAAHTKMQLRTETWLFGTGCRRVLSFGDKNVRRKADTILSIARLSGTDGTTDDGNCLEQIGKAITQTEERELASGKRIHLIFEVTDGASSFPGAAKAAVASLRQKNVEIQAIEIGLKHDEEARKTFQYIFGDHGTFLGDQTDRLPQTLLESVRRQMVSVFKGKSMS
ncbi:MAG: VWA domain-containing protein [Lachnospiraceae bacterium]|nr:VWA domain-containing protein [Lachnospiraceae bacterium]